MAKLAVATKDDKCDSANEGYTDPLFGVELMFFFIWTICLTDCRKSENGEGNVKLVQM